MHPCAGVNRNMALSQGYNQNNDWLTEVANSYVWLYYKYGLPQGYNGSTEEMENSCVWLYYIL